MIEIIGRGSTDDISAIKVSTIDGWHMPNERKPERSPDAMRQLERINKGNHPGLETRSLSATYNCVGMVFAGRRTFIDSAHLMTILNKDGYRKIEDSEAIAADLAVYFRDGKATHVGIVINVGYVGNMRVVKVLSQWGETGEYFHKAQIDRTEYGHPTYWTERKLP